MKGCYLEKWLIPGSVLYALLSSNLCAAQVVGDTTLPTGERSQVTGNPNFQIDGGARQGGKLFHSFQSFSIPTGGSAYFNNAADVQNIFSRITGGTVSNIDGVIRANGTANLFLLNPNGILFGPKASLNIGGSFVATTANAIAFPNGELFSSDATQPLPSQLLTVNPNAFFFNQLTPQPIIIQSRFNEMVFNLSSFNGTGLHVPPGQNLLLVGGPIQLDSGGSFSPGSLPGRPLLVVDGQEVQPDGGWLISPGSYVELGAVGGVGTVGLSMATEDWQLTIPNGVPRAEVSLGNGSGIDVRGASGSMRILAQNIDISRSVLLIGIPSDSRLPDTQTGDIELNATGSITINMSLLDNGLSGQGTIGNVNLTAGDRVSLDSAVVYNTVQSTGIGNAGNINITTGSLSLTNGALVHSYTNGQGNTGSVNINARDTVSFDDSNVYNNVNRIGVGNAGDINIATGALSLTNDALLSSFMFGQGNTGSVNINARDTVSLTRNAGLVSYTNGQGNAGSVNINAYNTISLDNSFVNNIVFLDGIGNSGGINITTGALSLTNGGRLLSATSGQGNAGRVNINARDHVFLDGEYSKEITVGGRIVGRYYITSSILTQVTPGATGQGGDVMIATGSLFLTNGGAVNTSTEGQGNAGRVTINARDSVQIIGTAPTRTDRRSEVFTSAIPGSVGSGGDVIITTRSLSVSDQGRINTNAQGQGKAGNIQIQASDTVSFNRGDAISRLEQGAVGRGGDIDITARSLSLFNGAQLAASTTGEGTAGNISVSANTVGLSRGGRVLTTTSTSGRAGDITVNTPDLQLSGATSGLFTETTSAGDAGDLTIQPPGNGQNVRVSLQQGAQISASTRGSGDGGTLTITAPESITLTGDGSVIAAETGGSGTGGNLNLRTGDLNIQNQAEVTVSSSGTGSAGSSFVDANQIYLNNGGRIRADTSGGGGNINLRSRDIILRNGSSISTNARGSNIPGGNINIDTDNLVAVPSENSDISANSRDFRGGNVTVRTNGIFGIEFREQLTPLSDITATGASSEFPGTVNIITPGIDPARGLAPLPTGVVDASDAIATSCPASQGNSFVVTGRGGLPPNPEQQLDDDAEWLDRRRLTVALQTYPRTDGSRQLSEGRLDTRHPVHHPPLIEATGWEMAPTGQVILTASAPNVTSPHRWGQPVNCDGS
jgi:filamentous hemagglutinin family protein